MTTRRTLIAGMALAPFAIWTQRALANAATALEASKLVYLTPIKSDGEESRCKAEIWFGYHGGDVYVVTPPDAWRAEAVGQGLTRARLWVGEFGVWTRADGAFREAPELMASASLTTDATLQAEVLEKMGAKVRRRRLEPLGRGVPQRAGGWRPGDDPLRHRRLRRCRASSACGGAGHRGWPSPMP